MEIHSTAIVSSDAVLGENIKVGPFSIIEEGVIIGDNCELAANAQVRRGSKIGNDCYIGSGALVGADPHFVGFDREILSGVVIGDHNEIREYVTIHRSIHEAGATRLGSHNFLMNGAHIGHDCEVGDHNTLANNTLLGGHVLMGSRCFLGGGSAFHQFVRIGDYVMAQGLAAMTKDTPPYVIAAGFNRIGGLNVIGLRRGGFDSAARKEIKEAFATVYQQKLNRKDFLEVAGKRDWGDAANVFFDFIRQESERCVCLRLRNQ